MSWREGLLPEGGTSWREGLLPAGGTTRTRLELHFEAMEHGAGSATRQEANTSVLPREPVSSSVMKCACSAGSVSEEH